MKELSEIFPFELVPRLFMHPVLPFRGAHMLITGLIALTSVPINGISASTILVNSEKVVTNDAPSIEE